MTTVFVAAEKLMNWASDASVLVDRTVAATLTSHIQNNRFIVYFSPSRFGLCFDSLDESREAWSYLESSLKIAGFAPQEVILFESEVEISAFKRVLGRLPPNEGAVLFSMYSQDYSLSELLGIRIVEEIPSNISSLWRRIDLRHAFKTLLAAIQV